MRALSPARPQYEAKEILGVGVTFPSDWCLRVESLRKGQGTFHFGCEIPNGHVANLVWSKHYFQICTPTLQLSLRNAPFTCCSLCLKGKKKLYIYIYNNKMI